MECTESSEVKHANTVITNCYTHTHTHSYVPCLNVVADRMYDCIPTRGYYSKRKTYCICLCVYIKASSVYLLEYSYE